MNEKLIKNKLINIIKSYPLNEDIKINNKTSLANAISLYGSLFEERLKIKLEENFPDVNFEKINHSTTLEQLIKLVANCELSNHDENSFEDILKESTQSPSAIINKPLDTFFRNKIGIDIENISSLPKKIFSNEEIELRKKLFSENEVIYSLSKSDPFLSLLGIFSAKESIIKCLSSIYPLKKFSFLEIEIFHNECGKPLAKVENLEKLSFEISISHSIDYVASVCLVFF